MMTPSEVERYGFSWPEKAEPKACQVNVTRVASIKRRNGENRIVSVETPKDQIAVYITPTGKIRVFKGHLEMKLDRNAPRV